MAKACLYACPIPRKTQWTKIGYSIDPERRLKDIFGSDLLQTIDYKIFNVTSTEHDALSLERAWKQMLKPFRVKRSLVCQHNRLIERIVPHTEVFKLSLDNLLLDLDDLVDEHTTLY